MIKKLIMMMMFISSVVFSTVFSEDKCEPHEPFDKKTVRSTLHIKEIAILEYLDDICFENTLYHVYRYSMEDYTDYYLTFIDKDLNWISFWSENMDFKSYKDEVIYENYKHDTTKWYIRLQLESFKYKEKYHSDTFSYSWEQMWYRGYDYKYSVCTFQNEPTIKYYDRAINCEASAKKPKK